VLRQSPDDYMALYHIGRCAALSGEQIERGIAALRRCLAVPAPAGDGKPRAADVHYRLGNLLEKKGEAAGARAEYAEALRENPDFRPAKVALRN
jgi:tetratricopeptide (TPR) repeat protein